MAGNPAFISIADNLAAADATTLAATSTESGYPVSRAAAEPLARFWRSADAALTNVDLTMDLGSAIDVTAFGLFDHNLTSSATIAVAAGSTTAYGDYSTTITYRQYDAWKYLTSAETYRYWRIRISDSGNPDNYIRVGYVLLGEPTETSKFLSGWSHADNFENNSFRSRFGVPYVGRHSYMEIFNLTYRLNTSAEMDVVRGIYRSAERDFLPLIWTPDIETSDVYFGRLEGGFAPTINRVQQIAGLQFVTDPRARVSS